MFIELKRKAPVQLSLSRDFMFSFFKRRLYKYFPGARNLEKIEIDLVRNFLGKFRNLTIKYSLYLDLGKTLEIKVLRGKCNAYHDNPRRYFKILSYLKKKKVPCPKPIDYLPYLNLLLYEDIPGISFQEMLSEKEYLPILENIPKIAKTLKILHEIKPSQDLILPKRDKRTINRENRHWLFLVKKCFPQKYQEFKNKLLKLNAYGEKTKIYDFDPKNLSLIHGDFHLGNILKQKDKIFILDFSDSFFSDPFEDLGYFLVQTRSMFRHYDFRNYRKIYPKIEKEFLKNYFGNNSSQKNFVSLYFWQARSLFQMTAIHTFVTPGKEAKRKGVNKYLRWISGYFRKLERII